jgi:hypothetical protein
VSNKLIARDILVLWGCFSILHAIKDMVWKTGFCSTALTTGSCIAIQNLEL